MRRSTRLRTKPTIDATYIQTNFAFDKDTNESNSEVKESDISASQENEFVTDSPKKIETESVTDKIAITEVKQKKEKHRKILLNGALNNTATEKNVHTKSAVDDKRKKKEKSNDISDKECIHDVKEKFSNRSISQTSNSVDIITPIIGKTKSKRKAIDKNIGFHSGESPVKFVIKSSINIHTPITIEAKPKLGNEIVAEGTTDNENLNQLNIVNASFNSIFPIAKKMPKIFLDSSKYDDGVIMNPKEAKGLMKVSLALKKHFPFKEELKKMLSGENTQSNDDVCGLDNVAIDDVPQSMTSNILPSSIRSDIDMNNTYFKTTKSTVNKIGSNEKEIEQIMKKSVLPDDLEKMEQAPNLYESQHQKKIERKKKNEETAGKGWYNLPKTEMTEEIKRDLQLIKMRNVLDAKHHYKRNDSNKLPTYFQVGTIVEGAHEYYSARATKKERKRTMVDELLDDAKLRKKNKQKLIEIQKKHTSGNKGHYKQMKNKRKPTWART